MNKLETYLKYLLIALPFVLLVVTPSTLFPFISSKVFLFQAFVEIVFFGWLALFILKPEKYRPKFSSLHWAIFLFLGALLLSSLPGPDIRRSLWGTYERMGGWITLAHYGVYFFLLGVFFRTKKDWLLSLRSFSVVGFLAVVYGFLQRFGVSWAVVYTDNIRMAGPLGNTAFFGSFMVFPIFLSGVLFFWDNHKKWRLFYIINFFTCLSGLLLSSSRGPAAGVAAGAVVFVVLGVLYARKTETRKVFMGMGVFLIVLSSLFLILQDSELIRENPVLGKYLKISLRDSNALSRFYNWKMTWQGIKERPLLGWGVDSNYFVFAENFNPEVLPYSNKWFDRPHNKYLGVGVSGGALSFLAYMAIFGFAFYYIYKSERMENIAKFGLASLLAAYMIQNVTLFDNPATYISLFLVLGVLSWAGCGSESAVRS